ncbi:hypothetical protein, partial [Pseudomonas fulva]|uniref:hypothetical protein n=1 Tax=Pseudomonas fulva TaxID=47880 RepID=UPI00244D2012
MKGLLFLLLVFLVGCKEESKMIVNLTMGEQLKTVMDASPLKISSDCMKSLGLCFHEFSKPFSSTVLPDVN